MSPSWTSLMLLADGRFPSGSYAHSGGLEAAVHDGLTLGDVPGFMAARLATVGRCEAAIAVAARRAAGRDEVDTLLCLDDEAQARCSAPPLREAASRLGSQLLRTAVTVWSRSTILPRYRSASESSPRPVCFGVVACAAGLPDEPAAAALLYDDAAAVTSAAVKLFPVDPALAARWLREAGATIDTLAREVSSREPAPWALPSAFAPLLEARSTAHAARERRLFAS